MKRIIRLTESELNKIIKKVISEAPDTYRTSNLANPEDFLPTYKSGSSAPVLNVPRPDINYPDIPQPKTAPVASNKETKPWSPTYKKVVGPRIDLRYGDSSPKVQQLQKELRLLGYRVGKTGADGKFGPVTQASVKVFQKNNGLEQTGIADTNTQKLIASQAKLKYQTSITTQANTPLNKYSLPGQGIKPPPAGNMVMKNAAKSTQKTTPNSYSGTYGNLGWEGKKKEKLPKPPPEQKPESRWKWK